MAADVYMHTNRNTNKHTYTYTHNLFITKSCRSWHNFHFRQVIATQYFQIKTYCIICKNVCIWLWMLPDFWNVMLHMHRSATLLQNNKNFFSFSFFLPFFSPHENVHDVLCIYFVYRLHSFNQSNVHPHTIPGIMWADHSKYSNRHFLLIVVFTFHLHTKWFLFILVDSYNGSHCIQQNLRKFTKRYGSVQSVFYSGHVLLYKCINEKRKKINKHTTGLSI